jgi:2-polyprenyl-6-methoxyphenol hydroxylase-like FAD-dependent oxidoreductase
MDSTLNSFTNTPQANETSAESWSNYISSEEVIKGLDEVPGPDKWSPMFKELVKITPPNTIVNFELLWRDPQLTWTSPAKRVIQIGDAAHTFLPASGNGATQAIEDAITIATCLQLSGKDKIPEAVEAHVRYR